MSRAKLIALGVVAGLVLLAGVFGGWHCARSCAPDPVEPIGPLVVGIDAGPGEAEIEARLAKQREDAAAAVAAIERKRAEELARLDAAERAEYEAARERGPEAVASWLNDWIEQRRGASAGGPNR